MTTAKKIEWKIYKNKEGLIIMPSDTLKCCFCGEVLLLHDFRASRMSKNDFYHCDVHMKCPNCSFFATFGIPITKEEYDDLRSSKLHGKILYLNTIDHFYSSIGKEESIKKKLKIYNYW